MGGGLGNDRLAGGGTTSQALVWAAIEPLVRRSTMAISNTEVDHSGNEISSRSAEPGRQEPSVRAHLGRAGQDCSGRSAGQGENKRFVCRFFWLNLQGELRELLGLEPQRLIG